MEGDKMERAEWPHPSGGEGGRGEAQLRLDCPLPWEEKKGGTPSSQGRMGSGRRVACGDLGGEGQASHCILQAT